MAKEINKAHDRCTRSGMAMVEHALKAGDALLKAKQVVGHGRFGDWLEKNCKVNARHAQRYMQIARNRDLLESQNASTLTLRGALSLLTHEQEVSQEEDDGITEEEPEQEDNDVEEEEPEDEDEGITEVEPEEEDSDSTEEDTEQEDEDVEEEPEDEDEGLEEERPEEEWSPPPSEQEKHEVRRSKFQRLLDGHRLTDAEQKVWDAVGENRDGFVRDIVKAARKHGARVYRKTPKELDVDEELLAMVLVSFALEKLDPVEAFAPPKQKEE